MTTAAPPNPPPTASSSSPAREPSAKPFMTVILTFAPDDGGAATGDTACVRHRSVADREAHGQMGLHGGWGRCTGQLAELVGGL